MIFDKDYMEYIKSKQKIPEDTNVLSSTASGFNNTKLEKENFLPAVKSAAAVQREKKLQSVQYECIKRKLKEQYEKKATLLSKRLDKKA